MKIAISATNPCHLYDLAKALHAQHALGAYFSGYPRWKLSPPADFPLRAHSARTLVTYGALRLPAALRPAPHRLFRWQDAGFDRAVGQQLAAEDGGTIHAMPGQALETFRRAQSLGIGAVLNHASGPVRAQLALVREEYDRAGVAFDASHGFDAAYFAREDAEYALAGRHCVASSIVRTQLVSAGIPAERIWVVPYGADPERFSPPSDNDPRELRRVVYAGQLTLRKGLRIALAALEEVRRSVPVTFDLYGPANRDVASLVQEMQRHEWIHLHGAVDQRALAEVFRRGTLLVLPSWEEAFGLVVVQALNCGLPCIVSDRVGAADLIVHRRNGSIFPAGDTQALAAEIAWWLEHPATYRAERIDWHAPAQRLLELSAAWRNE
ncbi:MAG TPA: glycosyltransferase family 4 protein [Opitutaceae bacterium]|nr:glycosyltransferase family 4 protein [Opitutaceae bacterium]